MHICDWNCSIVCRAQRLMRQRGDTQTQPAVESKVHWTQCHESLDLDSQHHVIYCLFGHLDPVCIPVRVILTCVLDVDGVQVALKVFLRPYCMGETGEPKVCYCLALPTIFQTVSRRLTFL